MTTSEQLRAEFEQLHREIPADLAPRLVPVLRPIEQAVVETRRRLEEIEKLIHS